MEVNQIKIWNPWTAAITGALGLLIVYGSLLTLLESPGYAFRQFLSLWGWMAALTLGFGIQAGLFVHIRQYVGGQGGKMTGRLAASGSASAGSMVLCCLHHVTEFLPLLGIAAFASFSVRYQTVFMGTGILMNVVAILGMLKNMQVHALYDRNGILGGLQYLPMGKITKGIWMFGFLVLSFYAWQL